MSFWSRLKRWARPAKYLVVEVEKQRPILGNTEDHVLAVRALEHNPGFQYLLAKLKLQRAVLNSHLRTTDGGLRQLIRLQEGIHWLGFLEAQLHKALEWQKPIPEEPMKDLQKHFEEIHFELFGTPPKP